MAKRRLSSGSTASSLLGDIVDEDDHFNDDNDSVFSGHGGNRRKSMMGGSNKNRRHSAGGGAAEQARIAEMYKTVIKLSSENKINEKNSWSLDLIDHMGKLIKDESTARGVNFQKASCTLDASVKIYSHRVDDTYASSHRILESLSRNGGGDDENGGTTERAAARVGTKSASNRLNLTETIARDLDTINSARVESEHAADPMFHKMSKAFDEGGARGMLMNNLRVTPGTCSLVFTSQGLSQDPIVLGEQAGSGAAGSSMVDISDLVFKCGFHLSDLSGLTVCPTLSQYRKTMGVAEDTTGSFPSEVVSASIWGDLPAGTTSSSSTSSSSSSSTFAAGAAGETAPSSSGAGYADEYVPQNDFDDYGADTYDGGNDDDDDCDEDGNYIASNRRATMATGMAAGGEGGLGVEKRASIGGEIQTQKIRWDSNVPGENTKEVVPVRWEGLGTQGAMTSGNEYAFFDLEALMKSNSWAGARHWRYAAKKAPGTSSADKAGDKDGEDVEGVEGGEEKAKKGGKKSKKEPFMLSFTDEPVNESCFVVNSKSRSDTTMQTTAAIEKASAAAAEGELFLPVDNKLQARDLCRLFHCQSMLVPPSMLTHMLQPSAQAQGVIGDLIWGQARPTAPSSSGGPMGYNVYDDGDGDDGDAGYGGGYEGDYGDDAHTGNGEAEMEVPEGLALRGDKLLQAARVVEKLEIGYATVAKRVNVRKLKGDLWSHISSQVAGSADEEESAASKEEGDDKAEKLSFQEVVNDLAVGQKQSEVTLPFYFICLLHLANEKSLKIEGRPTMDDLIISQD